MIQVKILRDIAIPTLETKINQIAGIVDVNVTVDVHEWYIAVVKYNV